MNTTLCHDSLVIFASQIVDVDSDISAYETLAGTKEVNKKNTGVSL